MAFKLDQKWFTPFIGAVAVASIFFIALFSVKFSVDQRNSVVQNLVGQDTLILSPVSTFESDGTIILSQRNGNSDLLMVFWAGWSDKSIQQWREIVDAFDHNTEITVVGAVVKDDPEYVKDVLNDIPSRHPLIDGTSWYGEWALPGIPSVLYFKNNRLDTLWIGKIEIEELKDYLK